MQAIRLKIDDRKRTNIGQISTLSNFTTTPDETIDTERILDDPNVSLYCLDHATRQAIFAELPPGIDLAQAPFYYQAQFDHAQRLIAVPYDVFHQLAAQISVDPTRLILMHNIGRCGSTLLSSALNEVDDVISFSEPDVFANFVALRDEDRAELIQLLRSCFQFTFRPAVVGQASHYSIKFRNQCADIIDLYVEAFPQAKHLFVYRNLFGWLASLYRLFMEHHSSLPPPISRDEAIHRQAAYYHREPAAVERFFDPAIDRYTVVTYLTTGWLVMMDRYLELFSAGFTPLTLRYEDLNTQPEKVLESLFAYCGLPVSDVKTALQAFERDSQENTKMARSNAQAGNKVRLPDALLSTVQTVLDAQAVIRQPDFVLPATVTFD